MATQVLDYATLSYPRAFARPKPSTRKAPTCWLHPTVSHSDNIPSCANRAFIILSNYVLACLFVYLLSGQDICCFVFPPSHLWRNLLLALHMVPVWLPVTDPALPLLMCPDPDPQEGGLTPRTGQSQHPIPVRGAGLRSGHGTQAGTTGVHGAEARSWFSLNMWPDSLTPFAPNQRQDLLPLPMGEDGPV